MDQVTLAKNQVRADSWRSLIRECQQSGLTVVQWCQTNNINTKTYYYWLRKLRTQALAEKELPVPLEHPEQPVAFKQLEVKSPVTGNHGELDYPLQSGLSFSGNRLSSETASEKGYHPL